MSSTPTQRLQALRIIWTAFQLSCAFFPIIIIVFNLLEIVEPHVFEPFHFILFFVGVGFYFLASLLRRALLRTQLPKIQLNDLEQVTQMLFSTLIPVWAICEAGAVIGFVVSFLTAEPFFSVMMSVISIFFIRGYRPSIEDLKEFLSPEKRAELDTLLRSANQHPTP